MIFSEYIDEINKNKHSTDELYEDLRKYYELNNINLPLPAPDSFKSWVHGSSVPGLSMAKDIIQSINTTLTVDSSELKKCLEESTLSIKTEPNETGFSSNDSVKEDTNEKETGLKDATFSELVIPYFKADPMFKSYMDIKRALVRESEARPGIVVPADTTLREIMGGRIVPSYEAAKEIINLFPEAKSEITDEQLSYSLRLTRINIKKTKPVNNRYWHKTVDLHPEVVIHIKSVDELKKRIELRITHLYESGIIKDDDFIIQRHVRKNSFNNYIEWLIREDLKKDNYHGEDSK